MGSTTLIVPATVPDATVTHLWRAETPRPIVVRAEPSPVPTARVIAVVPDQLTPDQVRRLRQENVLLRQELLRVSTG